MIFLAHSMGGQISCLFSALDQAATLGLRGIFGVGAGSPYRPAFEVKMGRRLGVGALLLGVVGGKMLGYWPGKVLGRDAVGYGRQSGTHMREWRRFHMHNSLDELGAMEINYVDEMQSVTLPILLTRCVNDKECPAASSQALASFLPKAEVQCEDLAAELGHNRWAREPDAVVARFMSFAEQLS